MSDMKRWIAAIAVVMSLFLGACATSPSRGPTGAFPPAREQAQGEKGRYSIPDFGTLQLSVPPSWKEEIKPEGPGSHFAFTVDFRGKAPEDFKVLISIYVEAATKGGVPDPQTVRSGLTEASKTLRDSAVEKDIAMLELTCTGGKGYYFSVTDATYKPGKPGDYQYMTQGMCPVGGRLLFFTVLTNSKDSEVVDRALHAVRTAERVVFEKLIAQIDFSSWSEKSFRVSPDSRRVAYLAKMGNKQFVVVDGKEEKQYDSIGGGTLIFSPDSKRVAYGATIGNKWFVVVDGKEEKQYDGLVKGGTIIFDSSDSLHYLARKGSIIYLVEKRIK